MIKEITLDKNINVVGNAIQQLNPHVPYFPHLVKGVYADYKYFSAYSTKLRLQSNGIWYAVQVNFEFESQDGPTLQDMYYMMQWIYSTQVAYKIDPDRDKVDTLQISEKERLLADKDS